MINLKKVRRQRKALELACLLLKVDDKVLDAYVKTGKLPGKTDKPKAKPKKVIEKVEKESKEDAKKDTKKSE